MVSGFKWLNLSEMSTQQEASEIIKEAILKAEAAGAPEKDIKAMKLANAFIYAVTHNDDNLTLDRLKANVVDTMMIADMFEQHSDEGFKGLIIPSSELIFQRK